MLRHPASTCVTTFAVLATAAVLVSCEKPRDAKLSPEAAKSPAAAPGAPAATPPAAPAAAPAAEPRPAAPDAKAAANEALGQLKTATAKVGETVKEAAAAAKDAAKAAVKDAVKDAAKDVPDLGTVTEPGFTPEKLKGILGSLPTERLRELADRLLGALQGKEDVTKALTEQIAKLGVADLGKLGDLKKQLEDATNAIKGLKEKLRLATDKLKEGGGDVSKYTSFLAGS